MTATPPPPPPVNPREVEEKAPPAAWLIPVAAVFAIVGLFTPWFKPQFEASAGSQTRSGDAVDDALYSFKEGRLGLIAPIVLVVVGFGVVKLLTGRSSRFHRGSRSPVQTAAFAGLGAGAVGIVSLALAYFLLPSSYKFEVDGRKLSWDDAEGFIKQTIGAEKLDLTQGPQLGFWLTGVAAILAIVGGVLMLVMRQKPEPVAAPPAGASGYGQPPAPDQPAYGQPPAPGQQAPSYGPSPTTPGQAPSFEKQSAPGEQPPSY